MFYANFLYVIIYTMMMSMRISTTTATILWLFGFCPGQSWWASTRQVKSRGLIHQPVLGYIVREHLWSWIYDHDTKYSNDQSSIWTVQMVKYNPFNHLYHPYRVR